MEEEEMGLTNSSDPDSDSFDYTMPAALTPPERFVRLPLYLQRLIPALDNIPDALDPEKDRELFSRLAPLLDTQTIVQKKPGTKSVLFDCMEQFTPGRLEALRRLEDAYKLYKLRGVGPLKNPYEDLRSYVQAAILPPLPRPVVVTGKVPASAAPGTAGTKPTAGSGTTYRNTTVANAAGATVKRIPDNVRKLNTIREIPLNEFKRKVRACESLLRRTCRPALID